MTNRRCMAIKKTFYCISDMLQKHFNSMLFNNPELKKVFQEPAMTALRQPPNLKNFCVVQNYIL